MVKEICSPVSRKGSKVGSGQPMSPGARSAPGKRETDSVPPQPSGVRSTMSEEPAPSSVRVTGPEE
jgi:hypothetical protein